MTDTLVENDFDSLISRLNFHLNTSYFALDIKFILFVNSKWAFIHISKRIVKNINTRKLFEAKRAVNIHVAIYYYSSDDLSFTFVDSILHQAHLTAARTDKLNIAHTPSLLFRSNTTLRKSRKIERNKLSNSRSQYEQFSGFRQIDFGR